MTFSKSKHRGNPAGGELFLVGIATFGQKGCGSKMGLGLRGGRSHCHPSKWGWGGGVRLELGAKPRFLTEELGSAYSLLSKAEESQVALREMEGGRHPCVRKAGRWHSLNTEKLPSSHAWEYSHNALQRSEERHRRERVHTSPTMPFQPKCHGMASGLWQGMPCGFSPSKPPMEVQDILFF